MLTCFDHSAGGRLRQGFSIRQEATRSCVATHHASDASLMIADPQQPASDLFDQRRTLIGTHTISVLELASFHAVLNLV